MKKFFYLIAAAALLLPASCAKNTLAPADGNRQIAFTTASYATKVGISGTQFPTTESFGVFAWTEGTTGPYFMDNEVVSLRAEDGIWTTATPYFWPLDQTVDFVCFYPAEMTAITVDKAKISYVAYDVEANPTVDVMYADKAAGFSDYPERVPGSATGYTGVPAIFRHALSKISVDMSLAYSHKEEADGTVTDWEVTVNSASLSGVHMKGDCELTLADTPTVGLVGWVKPEGNVWTADQSVLETKNYLEAATALEAGKSVSAVPEMFVLPQTLAAGQQKVDLNITIKTIRNGKLFLSETMDVSADLIVPGKITAWQMNHAIAYRLSVRPTRSSGVDPSDPSKPVDPNDPELKDVRISFDPAVSGWDVVTVAGEIAL